MKGRAFAHSRAGRYPPTSIARRERRMPESAGWCPHGSRLTAVLVLMAFVAAMMIVGPAMGQTDSRGPLVVDAIEPRIDVVAGSVLVAPVRVVGDTSSVKSLQARLDDGRTVEALLRCVSVTLDPSAPATWLPSAAKWSVDTKPAGGPDGVGATWVLVIQLPADAAGQSVWIGNSKLPLNWLPAPSALVRAGGRFGWPAPLEASKLTPELRALLTPEAESPVRRWRHRLHSPARSRVS